MFTKTDIAIFCGVVIGVVLSGLIPGDWPLWQEVAAVIVVCAVIYAVMKFIGRPAKAEPPSK